jgi:hypothetical protein
VGVIAFGNDSISSIVRSVLISEACLEAATSLGIPEVLTLLIECDQMKRQRHVPWIEDKRIGILFV